VQGEGDHPALGAERKGPERSGGLHETQPGSPAGVLYPLGEWSGGSLGRLLARAGRLASLGVFDLKAAQRRMHLVLRGAAGCPRWEGEPEDEAGAFPASAGAGEGRSSSPSRPDSRAVRANSGWLLRSTRLKPICYWAIRDDCFLHCSSRGETGRHVASIRLTKMMSLTASSVRSSIMVEVRCRACSVHRASPRGTQCGFGSRHRARDTQVEHRGTARLQGGRAPRLPERHEAQVRPPGPLVGAMDVRQ